MAIGFRRSHQPLSPVRIEDRIRCAYTLIEAARIRCEQLGDQVRLIHRDLGLAGFYCSEEMPIGARHGCLAQAHGSSDECAADRRETLRKIFEETLTAADVLGEILPEAPSDHLHVAHLHAISALETLDTQLLTAVR